MFYFRTVINVFTWLFLGVLVAVTATQLWLAKRQIDYVRKHRDVVPEMFAEAVPLPSHQKAADYSVAKDGWKWRKFWWAPSRCSF